MSQSAAATAENHQQQRVKPNSTETPYSQMSFIRGTISIMSLHKTATNKHIKYRVSKNIIHKR